MPLPTIGSILGHSTIRTTGDICTHLAGTEKQAAIDRPGVLYGS